MFRSVLFLCVAFALSGCTSLSYPLAKCDGYSRRPLNRSMWQWQDNHALERQHSDFVPDGPARHASAYAAHQPAEGPAAFDNFAGSYSRCGEI
nr:hypothetical protein [Ensifer sp. IC4062]